MSRRVLTLGPQLVGWLIGGACLSIAVLAWVGHRATVEWQRSATLVADERASAAVNFMVTAVTRDMRGVQLAVLPSPPANPSDVRDRVASAFARYPYPEIFFTWRRTAAPAAVIFYARSDRYPSWIPRAPSQQRVPVLLASEPATARRLVDRVNGDADRGRVFSIFVMDIAGVPYQVVVSLTYDDPLREHLGVAFGFMVNLHWVRHHYFQKLTSQVATIPGVGSGIAFAVFDQTGAPIVGDLRDVPEHGVGRRVFPLMFFDPILVAGDAPRDFVWESWKARAEASGDPTLLAANRGARQTLNIAAVTALVLLVACVLSVRALRASADLAAIRSDFVAMMTHELKTPLATIRAVGETVASGRSTTEQMSREYAQISVDESKRLTRLIDNLLAYARVTDITDAYAFEPISAETLVSEALHEFAPQLTAGGFDLQVEIAPQLPPVRVDRSAVRLMLGNLLDNAIRYSHAARQIRLTVHRHGGSIVIEFADRGIGISADEIPHVTRKFFRGRDARASGSGLGLAIVDRIVADHGGVLGIQSAVGVGTTVRVTLPIAEAPYDQTDSHR